MGLESPCHMHTAGEQGRREREQHLLHMCHPVQVIGRALCGFPLSHAHCWRTNKKRAAPIAHEPPRTSDWQNSMWYSSSSTSDCMRTDTRSSSAEWACWHFTPCGQSPEKKVLYNISHTVLMKIRYNDNFLGNKCSCYKEHLL